ncbi:hypothetical protein HK097_005153, partial [Rhizophlyctis rosea]
MDIHRMLSQGIEGRPWTAGMKLQSFTLQRVKYPNASLSIASSSHRSPCFHHRRILNPTSSIGYYLLHRSTSTTLLTTLPEQPQPPPEPIHPPTNPDSSPPLYTIDPIAICRKVVKAGGGGKVLSTYSQFQHRMKHNRIGRTAFLEILTELQQHHLVPHYTHPRIRKVLKTMKEQGHKWGPAEYILYAKTGERGGMTSEAAIKLLSEYAELEPEPHPDLLHSLVQAVGMGDLPSLLQFWTDHILGSTTSPIPLKTYKHMAGLMALHGSSTGVDTIISQLHTLGYADRRWECAKRMKAYSIAGLDSEAHEIWNEVKDMGGLNSEMFNIYIYMLAKRRQSREAVDAFEEMGGNNLEPIPHVYKVLIDKLCGEGEKETALYYYKEMVRKGFRPQSHVYASLFKVLAHQQDRESFERLVEDLERLEVPSHPRLLSALVYAYFHFNEPETALEIAWIAQEHGLDSDPTFPHTLLNGVLNSGTIKHLTSRLTSPSPSDDDYKPPSANIMVIGMAAAILSSDSPTATKIFDILLTLQSTRVDPLVLALLTHTHILKKDLTRAQQVLDAMRSNPRSKKYLAAKSLPVSEAASTKVRTPYFVAASALITAYCKAGKMAEARNVLEDLWEMGYESFPPLASSFVGACLREGDLNGAIGFLKEWRTRGAGVVDVVLWRILYKGYIKRELIKREEVVWHHGKRKFALKDGVEKSLGSSRSVQREDLFRQTREDFFNDLRNAGWWEIDAGTWEALLDHHCFLNEVGDAESVFVEMQGEGVELSVGSRAKLRELYLRVGEVEKAEALGFEGDF